MALVDVEQVAFDILADHEPWRLRAAAHPTDVQALALAEGVVEDARVFAHAVAGRIADLAGAGGQVAAEELAEVALADEADSGRILLRCGGKALLRCDPAYLVLVQFAEREARCSQLMLAELMQEIALVLAAILRPQQAVAAV